MDEFNLKYYIITFCSHNYRRLYHITIPSWLRSDSEKIIIYTDDIGWKSDNNKVIIINKFKKERDWLKNVAKKHECIYDFIQRFPTIDNAVFLDADCYVVNELSQVFNRQFSLALTTSRRKDKMALSSGVIFFRRTMRLKDIVTDLLQTQRNMIRQNIGYNRHRTHDELSLEEISSRYKDNCLFLEDDFNFVVNMNDHAIAAKADIMSQKPISIFHFVKKQELTWINHFVNFSHETTPIEILEGDTLSYLLGNYWEKIYNLECNIEFRKINPNPNNLKLGSIINRPAYRPGKSLMVVTRLGKVGSSALQKACSFLLGFEDKGEPLNSGSLTGRHDLNKEFWLDLWKRIERLKTGCVVKEVNQYNFFIKQFNIIKEYFNILFIIRPIGQRNFCRKMAGWWTLAEKKYKYFYNFIESHPECPVINYKDFIFNENILKDILSRWYNIDHTESYQDQEFLLKRNETMKKIALALNYNGDLNNDLTMYEFIETRDHQLLQ